MATVVRRGKIGETFKGSGGGKGPLSTPFSRIYFGRGLKKKRRKVEEGFFLFPFPEGSGVKGNYDKGPLRLLKLSSPPPPGSEEEEEEGEMVEIYISSRFRAIGVEKEMVFFFREKERKLME